VPSETSILAGIFPMHIGSHGAHSPIHIYSHSFLRFGHLEAFKRSGDELFVRSNSSVPTVLEHPCLPRDLAWHVWQGEYGVSTSHMHPDRRHGPIELRGAGNFDDCLQLAEGLIDSEVECFQPPCSFAGVYQPQLNNTKFVMLGEYDSLQAWQVQPLIAFDNMPFLEALEHQFRTICALPLATNLELFGPGGLTKNGTPPCWRGTWMFAVLTKGLRFEKSTRNIEVVQGCCDNAVGHVIYEVNFFPYKVRKDTYLHASSLTILDGLHDAGGRGLAFLTATAAAPLSGGRFAFVMAIGVAVGFVAAIFLVALGAFTFKVVARRRRRADTASGLRGLLLFGENA